jgi:nitrate reductase beta subunit
VAHHDDPQPVAAGVSNFHGLTTAPTGPLVEPQERHGRINLLTWNGQGSPTGLFPPRREPSTVTGAPTGDRP